MKIALYSQFGPMLASDGIHKTAEFVLEHGLSAVEILTDANGLSCDSITDVKTAHTIRKALDSYDLPVVCYSVFCDTLQADIVDKMKAKLEIAKALGTPFVHHTILPMARNQDYDDYDEKLKPAVKAAEAIANYAETLGITCLYEEQGYYVNGVAGYGKFYGEMKKRCANIGVCADMGNILFVNEKPEDFFRTYIADIKHVHLKDYLHKVTTINPGMQWRSLAENHWIRNTMIGHGVVNYPECMKLLKDAGYEGAYSLELCHPEPYTDGIKQALEYVDRIKGII